MIDDLRLPERFWAKVSPCPMTGCWLWTGYVKENGYAQFGAGQLAHRVAYLALVGPIPLGLQLDHVKARGCSARCCVNPDHLEPVTPRVNTLRSSGLPALNAAKTHCDNGHPFDETTYIWKDGARRCSPCRRASVRRYRARLAASGSG